MSHVKPFKNFTENPLFQNQMVFICLYRVNSVNGMGSSSSCDKNVESSKIRVNACADMTRLAGKIPVGYLNRDNKAYEIYRYDNGDISVIEVSDGDDGKFFLRFNSDLTNAVIEQHIF